MFVISQDKIVIQKIMLTELLNVKGVNVKTSSKIQLNDKNQPSFHSFKISMNWLEK